MSLGGEETREGFVHTRRLLQFSCRSRPTGVVGLDETFVVYAAEHIFVLTVGLWARPSPLAHDSPLLHANEMGGGGSFVRLL